MSVPDLKERQQIDNSKNTREWGDFAAPKDEILREKAFEEKYEHSGFFGRTLDAMKYMGENLKKSVDELSHLTEKGQHNWDLARERIYARPEKSKSLNDVETPRPRNDDLFEEYGMFVSPFS